MRCLPTLMGLMSLFMLFLITLYFAHLDIIQSLDKINKRAGLSLKEKDIIEIHSEKYHYVIFKVSKERFKDYLKKVDDWCGCSIGIEICDGRPRYTVFYKEEYENGQKIYQCSKEFHSYNFQEPYYIKYSYYANSWVD